MRAQEEKNKGIKKTGRQNVYHNLFTYELCCRRTSRRNCSRNRIRHTVPYPTAMKKTSVQRSVTDRPMGNTPRVSPGTT